MISHRNVIANVLQIQAFEATWRDSLKAPGTQGNHTEVALCLLPQSHIYCLVVICHSAPFRGDQALVLPKFDLELYLASIQNFKISSLFLVSNSTHLNALFRHVSQLLTELGPSDHHQHAAQP
jgi:acyl-CoA synthetase (AMP-forming)/AMP-acid ligase II